MATTPEGLLLFGGRRAEIGDVTGIFEWQGDHWRCVANCTRESEPFDEFASEPGAHVDSSAEFDPNTGQTYLLEGGASATWFFADRAWTLLGRDPHPDLNSTPFGPDPTGRLITVGGGSSIDAYSFDPSSVPGSRWTLL